MSILNSIKKLLGIPVEDTSFDQDILIHINSAIFILKQIGIGKDSFTVFSEKETYEDFLGEFYPHDAVGLYIYYRTRLGFDSPSSSSLYNYIEQELAELEWRLLHEKEEQEALDKEKQREEV